ncbi:MAG: radical SAM protein, partial [Vampirovibrionia bacterium]
MINILKKFAILYSLISNNEITTTPLSVLKSLNKKRVPDNVMNELSFKKSFLPFKSLFYMYNWLKYETITVMYDGKYVINSFLPPMPGNGYNRMFENLLSGRKISPVSAYIAITSRCSYDCWHCSYKKRNNEEMDFTLISKTIDELIDLGVSIIGITGGEPTLRNDLVDIVTKISYNADSMLFTNGYGFTDELALRLKNAGLWAVAISLDSYISDEHNKKRGNVEAYSRAIEAINVAVKHSFYTMITTVP